MVHHSNDDAMNKIPLKSSNGLDDEEKNGDELIQDTAAAEEARREQMRANLLAWMKKLTIGLICFIGIALISYVIISLCLSDWSKSARITNSTVAKATTPAPAAIVGSSTATAATAFTDDVAEAAPSTPSPPPPTATTTTTIRTTSTTTTTTTTESTPTTTTTPPSNPSTSHTLKPFNSTDEQSLPPASVSDSSNVEATTTTSEEIAVAGPAVAASTSPTTPPPSTAPILDDADAKSKKEFSSKLGVYQHAAVCSDTDACSQIGSNILERNGTAVDATIATMLCNGLLTSQSMGIGGGLIMNIYHRESQQGYQIDAQAVAPYASHQKMFDKDANASIFGPLSIAVPGEVMGYHLAHKRFGKLPWRTLVEPSLKICETGYRMSNHQASKVKMMWSYIKDNLQYQSVFLNEETGEHHQEGALLKPPAKLCNTYKLLAENGPMDFYNGTVAQMLAEDLKELGSIITQDDLDTYTADLRLSVTMPLGNDTLYAVPPVSSGSVVAHILGILEGFNFTRADLADDESYALTIHRITEALKFGFAHRPELGDPRFNDIRELVSQLTNPQYAAQQRAKINDNQVLGSPQDYGALLSSEEDPYGTSSFAVLAPNGDAVAVTSSINNYFGSSLIGPRTGIILNDCMNDFSVKENIFNLPQSQANTIDLHKRPMSSQSPMLLADRDGNIRLAIGAAGGTKIVGGIVEVAARFLWFGEDLKTAEDAPRFYNQLFPNVLEYEDGKFSENVLSLLRKRGHILKPLSQKASSVVCAIGRNATAIYANADGRKQGGVGGF
ncbi:scoloptoxin SSD14 isoform X2 [Drosophila mojavensis]|nr:scoloptoxin SSD14 isoform X2 [Drosophila mojavensis]KRF93793.1 uncharacterized protein Dmoj_GI15346, isoform B [Drosophila mojavensis]